MKYYFKVKITKKNYLVYHILTSFINNSNKIYKTKKEMRDKENSLYDLYVGCDSFIDGNVCYFSFNIDLVDENIIGNNYYKEAIKYIKDYIFNVNFKNKLELDNIKNRMINNLYNIKPEINANIKFIHNLLKDDLSEQIQICDLDELKIELNKIHLSDLEKAYNNVFKSYVTGYIMGNISNDNLNISNCFNEAVKMNKNYYKKFHIEDNYTEMVDDKTNQSFLYVTYEINNFNKNKAALYRLMEQLLGGKINSLLMTILRKKYGLVYMARGNYVAKRNIFFIKAYIDENNKDKTIEAIEEVFTLISDEKLVTNNINSYIELEKQNK